MRSLRKNIFCIAVLFVASPADAELFRRTKEVIGSVGWMESVGGQLWISAGKAGEPSQLYRTEADGRPHVVTGGTGIRRVVHAGSETWGVDYQTLFRLLPDRRFVQVHNFGGMLEMFADDGGLWLVHEAGVPAVFRQYGDHLEAVAGVPPIAEGIGTADGALWVSACNDANSQHYTCVIYAVSNKGTVVIASGNSKPISIATSGGNVWIGLQSSRAAPGGLLRISEDGNITRVEGITESVVRIVPTMDGVWAGVHNPNGGGGLFRVFSNASARRVATISGPAIDLQADADSVWVGSGISPSGDPGGMFHVDAQLHTQRVAGIVGAVTQILPDGDQMWVSVAGHSTLFRVHNFQATSIEGFRSVDFMAFVGGTLWVAGTDEFDEPGLFRIDHDASVSATLDTGLPLLRGLLWWRDQAKLLPVYRDATGVPISTLEIGKIEFCYGATESELDSNIEKGVWQDSAVAYLPLKLGPAAIYTMVRDSWGNQRRLPPIVGFGLPAVGSLLALIAVTLALFCLACLLLCPHSLYCQRLLMSPNLRAYGSFGLIPMLLELAPLFRRRVLLRYRWSVAHAFAESAATYVVPDERLSAAVVLPRLERSGAFALVGSSGAGKTAWLRNLTHALATNPGGRLPVYVDLGMHGNLTPRAMVADQLRTLGEISDEKLQDVLIAHGEFAFLFDALNEAPPASAHQVLQYIEAERRRNRACVSAQIPSVALRKVAEVIECTPLTLDRICAIAKARQTVAVDEFVEQLRTSDAARALGANPFQLILMLDAWARLRHLASTPDELYLPLLKPFLSSEGWAAPDYPDRLAEQAFQMLAERKPYDPQEGAIPAEMLDRLEAERVLVKPAGAYEFRHDRLRAYLASRHFSRAPARILTAETTVLNSNWDVMLEFHLLQEAEPQRTKSMLLLILNKDLDMAGRLYRWLLANRPRLADGWRVEFEQSYGRRSLDPFGLMENVEAATNA